MEEFVMDLLVFLKKQITTSGDILHESPCGEAFQNMTREELEVYYTNSGINQAASSALDFVLKRVQLYVDERLKNKSWEELP